MAVSLRFGVSPDGGAEACWYRNHILRALFPVLTTDLLTPFIDLLEDVMLQQVPPLVVSRVPS